MQDFVIFQRLNTDCFKKGLRVASFIEPDFEIEQSFLACYVNITVAKYN